MFNTTIEIAGYESKDKKNDRERAIRVNRIHIVDAQAFLPDTPKGRAMVSVTTIRDTHIFWYPDMLGAEYCVKECLPTEIEDPINQMIEHMVGVLTELIEEAGGMENLFGSNAASDAESIEDDDDGEQESPVENPPDAEVPTKE